MNRVVRTDPANEKSPSSACTSGWDCRKGLPCVVIIACPHTMESRARWYCGELGTSRV